MSLSGDDLNSFLARVFRIRREVYEQARAALASLNLDDVIAPTTLADERRTKESIVKLEKWLELLEIGKFAVIQEQAAIARDFAQMISQLSPEEQQVWNTNLQVRLLAQSLNEVAGLDACAELGTAAKGICSFIDSCRGRCEIRGSEILFARDDDIETYKEQFSRLEQAYAKYLTSKSGEA